MMRWHWPQWERATARLPDPLAGLDHPADAPYDPHDPAEPEADPQERLQRGLELSFAYLNRRERTTHEVRSHLTAKGVASDTVEACLQELAHLGYVDDDRYALMYVHDKRELEGWGSERIRRGLAERGVGRDQIEAAMAAHEARWAPGESELDRALALLRRRFPVAPRERNERNRALGMLIRRGFESELALDALTAYARGE